jgi:glucosamine kinase
MTAAPLFLGLDGGASRCRVRLRDAGGAILAEGEGPPANVYYDFTAAMAVIVETMHDALAKAGVARDAFGRVAAGLGLAGVSAHTDAVRVAERLTEFGSVRVANDAVTACLGAHGGKDGGVVIAGTGTAAMALVGGKQTVIGGRGFVLGDDGSAAHIGHAALRRALLAHDGIAPATPLTERLMAKFDNDPVVLLEWATTARVADYGALAPEVLAAAEDPVGRGIAMEAGAAIAALGLAVRRLGAARIALVGGLAEAIAPFLPAGHEALFSPPLYDATDGAILLAGGRLPQPAESAP